MKTDATLYTAYRPDGATVLFTIRENYLVTVEPRQ